jgi:mono/diheme cytochrome c family protein
MQRSRRIASRIGIGLAALLVASAALPAWTWWASERYLHGFPAPPVFAAATPVDAASLARGHHIALTRGCHSCHGERFQGQVHPWAGRAVAVNLAEYTRRQPIARFERALRHGIGSDGRALYSMPSFAYARLRDDEVTALYGWLRQVPVATDPLPTRWLDWKTRWALATGTDIAIPAVVAKMPHLAWQGHPDPAVRRGEHLAMTICSECHGLSLHADNPWPPETPPIPPLTIAASYDKADFIRLMRTGKPPGGRDLGLMTATARDRFVHWSNAEVDDLYAFLTAFGHAPG